MADPHTTLSKAERNCGLAAYELVHNAGGFLSFDAYDKKARSELNIWPPLNWCAGWGNVITLRENNNKLSAFAAVKMGLLAQEEGGYKCLKQ